jgi:hypothetical protein
MFRPPSWRSIAAIWSHSKQNSRHFGVFGGNAVVDFQVHRQVRPIFGPWTAIGARRVTSFSPMLGRERADEDRSADPYGIYGFGQDERMVVARENSAS